jgi:hypothetical protein
MTTTQTKYCTGCREDLPTTQFSKCSRRDDGLQYKCKECNKIDNHKFRVHLKPKYQVDWQRTNKPKWTKYMVEWNKINTSADDSRSKIYCITNPNEEIYVGHSQTVFSARKSAHKKDYKHNKGALPYLHKSFDDFGYENHKWITMDMSGVDKKTLEIIEYAMANEFTKLGISLNKRLK